MTNRMEKISAILVVPHADGALIDALMSQSEFEPERFDGAGIDGGGDVATVIISLGTASLTALVAILRAHWNRARYVKIEVDGVKVEGVSPEGVKGVLKTLLDERTARQPAVTGQTKSAPASGSDEA